MGELAGSYPLDTASKGGESMAILRFGARSFPTLCCRDGRERGGVRQPRSSELGPLLRRNSGVKLIDNMRVLFGIVGVFVGAYAYSPPVMAEGEEVSSQDESAYGSDMPAMLRGVINHTIDIENDDADGLSNVDYYRINNLHIPETVWSIDVSTVDHLGHISGEPEAATDTEFGGRLEGHEFGARLERADFWSRTALGLWSDSATNRPPNSLIPPGLFQVASCGGSYAEHSDLDFCGDANISKINELIDNSTDGKHVNNNSTIQDTDNNTTNSNDNSSLSSNTHSAPSIITTLMSPSVDLALAGQCDGVAASCAPFYIDSPADLIAAYAPDPSTLPIDTSSGDGSTSSGDGSTSSGDGSTYPPPYLGEGDSGVDSGQKPIPEAPTWVMTAIGFGVVAFVFRKKRNSITDSISIIENT
jgi:hypothetical protein